MLEHALLIYVEQRALREEATACGQRRSSKCRRSDIRTSCSVGEFVLSSKAIALSVGELHSSDNRGGFVALKGVWCLFLL